MAAKPRPKKPEPAPPPHRLTRWLLQCALLLALVAGSVAAIIALGRWGHEQQRGKERYLVPVGDIECEPPAAMTKAEFLEQVRYEARLPERLDLLDDEMENLLFEAFRRHPWVEKVESVSRIPPNRIHVKLHHRTPVLAVQWDEGMRAVDGFGVLLPKNAPTRGLPVYDGRPLPPKGPAGSRWGDPNLEQEARRLKK